MTAVSPEDIEAFIEIFQASDWEQVDLIIGDFELHLSKNSTPAPSSQLTISPSPHALTSDEPPDAQLQDLTAPPPTSVPTASAGWIEIQAPHLGTFYRAPKPGHAAYVEVGQNVNADSEVCLLEVMKLFTSLRAGVSGIIRQICVRDSTLVEGGQVLFMIEPTL